MTAPARRHGLAAALLAACLAAGVHAQALPAPDTPAAATVGGPPWAALTPAQQSALAPLKKDWQTIDAPRKQKWLEIAARFPSLPLEERQRIQQRMGEWARMTPEQRGRARLQFQEARQISPQDRQARWDAYLALPAEERRSLAESARRVPKAEGAGASASLSAAPARSSGVTPAPTVPAAKIVAPTVVQARPGASTTLISNTATPPPHAQTGKPRIAKAGPKPQPERAAPQVPDAAAEAASAASAAQ